MKRKTFYYILTEDGDRFDPVGVTDSIMAFSKYIQDRVKMIEDSSEKIHIGTLKAASVEDAIFQLEAEYQSSNMDSGCEIQLKGVQSTGDLFAYTLIEEDSIEETTDIAFDQTLRLKELVQRTAELHALMQMISCDDYAKSIMAKGFASMIVRFIVWAALTDGPGRMADLNPALLEDLQTAFPMLDIHKLYRIGEYDLWWSDLIDQTYWLRDMFLGPPFSENERNDVIMNRSAMDYHIHKAK